MPTILGELLDQISAIKSKASWVANPARFVLDPEDFIKLEEEMGVVLRDHLTRQDGRLALAGVPIVVFEHHYDPLYKELKALAKLVGARVYYPEFQRFNEEVVSIAAPSRDVNLLAEFFKDGSGWRYTPASCTLQGVSRLEPISAPWPACNTYFQEPR
jgi:hypothetical protein